MQVDGEPLYNAHSEGNPIGRDKDSQWSTPGDAFDIERDNEGAQCGKHAEDPGEAHEHGVEMKAETQPSRNGQDYAGHRQKEHWQVPVGCDAQLTPIA